MRRLAVLSAVLFLLLPGAALAQGLPALTLNDGPDGTTYSLSLQIVDEGSDNGVRVEGMRAEPGTPHPLRSGDTVELGDVAYVFLDGPSFFDHLPRMLDG